MAVTAKVTLSSKTVYASGSAVLDFVPDYQDGQNKEWATSTPNLALKMTVIEEVAKLFTPGDKYTLTFEKS